MRGIKIVLLVLFVTVLLSGAAFCAGADDNYNSGIQLFKQGEYKKAAALFTAAAKQEPKNPKHFKALAACYQKMGNKAAAQKFLNHSKKLSSGAGGATAAPRKESKSFNITAFGGFATVSMKAINDMIDVTLPGVTVTLFGPGFIGGARFGFAVMPGLYVGPAFEFIAASAKVSSSAAWVEYNASIIPLMAGASYEFSPEGIPLDICGQVYIGYGFAGFSYTSSLGGTQPEFSGGAFVADIEGKISYKFSDSVSAGLIIGYRLANVSEIKLAKDWGFMQAGEVMKDSSGNPVPADFSGFTIAPCVNFKF